MRGVYTASHEAAYTGTKTMLHIANVADMVLEILSVTVTQSEDDTAEQFEVGVFRSTTVGSPAGSAVTVEKHEFGDVDSSVTALGNLTAEPTTYSGQPIDQQGFLNTSGYYYEPLPEERPIISPSQGFGVRLLTAPDASENFIIQIKFREIGG